MDSNQLIRSAALNNAEWCNIVCAGNRAPGDITGDLWSTIYPVPRYYGNIVTLTEKVSEDDIKPIVDQLSGRVGVKDSFGTLELTQWGFHKLFDAQWVLAPEHGVGPFDHVIINTAEQLAEWEIAWNGGEALGIFNMSILNNPLVQFVAIYCREMIVAGAIINRSEHVIGVSNVFCPAEEAHNYWFSLLTAAHAVDEEMPVVGYEGGDVLEFVKQIGFTALGPLTVWERPAE